MKIRLTAILSALALLTTSCEQDPDAGSAWGDPKFVRVVAPTEMVRSGSTEQEIFYMEDQQIKVWDHGGNAVNLKINKDNDSVFFSYSWIPDAVPAYAAFPSTEETSCNDGVFEINVDTEQKVLVPGKIETFVAVGRVTGANRQSYKVSPLRNITGFVELDFKLPFIESIILEAPGGEPLAGNVSVDCGKLEKDEDAWVTAIDCSSSVTVRPAKAGGFIDAGVYYVSVLPGYYSMGLKVTVNYKNGQPLERTYGEDGLTVIRSAVLDLDINAIDSDLLSKLPDEIRIDLDFSKGWPFVEETVSAARQEETDFAEDTYTYMYKFEYDGIEEEFAVPLLIKGNKTAYLYANNAFNPGNAWSSVVLPALPEHYLRAIRLEVKNSVGKTYLVNDYKTGTRFLEFTVPATKDSPSILSFPTEDGITPAMATQYRMSFREGGAVITGISLLYSKELPSEYDDNPFGDKPQEPEPPVEPETDLPDEIRVDLDFASWPFVEPIATNETQTAGNYAGDTYTYIYNYEVDGEHKTKNLSFFIRHNGVIYTHSAGALRPGDTDKTRMTLPAISGRYIRAVRMEVGNAYAKSFRLNKMDWTELVTSSGAVTDAPALLSFPTEDGVISESGVSYYMYFINKSTVIKKISILYSKELPSSPSDEDPFSE